MKLSFNIKKSVQMSKYLMLFLIMASVTLISPLQAQAHGDLSKHKKQAIVFVIDNIELSELADPSLKNIHELIDDGSLGLMNVRNAAGNYKDGSGYLTLGAGTKAAAGVRGREGFFGSEIIQKNFGSVKASEEFNDKTGQSVRDSDLVFLGIENIKARSANVPLNITPGLLGEQLKINELSSAMIGNLDTDSAIHRETAMMLMDISGRLPNAYFPNRIDGSGTLAPDPFIAKVHPTITGTELLDSELLLNYWEKVRDKNLVAIILGDTARVNISASSYSPDILVKERQRALRESDAVIGKFMDKVKSVDPNLENHLIMVITPNPNGASLSQKNFLTPVIISGEDFTGGTLKTPTTRRHGVITSMDFAPTILEYFGIETPVGMSGRPVFMTPDSDPFGTLTSLIENSVPMRNTRNSVLGAFTTVNIALVIIFLVYFFLYPKGKTTFTRIFPTLVLVLMAFPVAFLFQYPVTYANILFAISLSCLLTLVIGIGAYLIFRRKILDAIMAICALTWLALAGDLLSGGHLMLMSYFGSDVIAGGRFYGIGNTYMGVLMGATLVGLGCFWHTSALSEKVKQLISIPLLLITAILIGHPALGANVGGMITGVAGLVLFYFLVVYKQLRFYHFMALAGAILVGLGALISVDLFLSSSPTHAAGAFKDIQSNGFAEILEIIRRKWALNMKFFSSSALSAMLTLMMIALIPLLSNAKGRLKEIVDAYPALIRSLIAAVYTAIVALVFNDTGIVAATAASQFIISPLLILLSIAMAENVTERPGGEQ